MFLPRRGRLTFTGLAPLARCLLWLTYGAARALAAQPPGRQLRFLAHDGFVPISLSTASRPCRRSTSGCRQVVGLTDVKG